MKNFVNTPLVDNRPRWPVILIAVMTLQPIALFGEEQAAENEAQHVTHMSEEMRAEFRHVVVLPSVAPPSGMLAGSYARETAGLLDGAVQGAEIGIIRKDIGGIPIGFPIPVLRELGAIFGGISGGMKRQIQDFRDALTEDLVSTGGLQLTNDALATDVFWNIRNVRTLKPKILALDKPIPANTDAILYVTMKQLEINVEEDRATITTTADAVLQRQSDGSHVYVREVTYSDTDTLKNWVKNDKAAWRSFANYSRHSIGREISADVFESIRLNRTLQPLIAAGNKHKKKNPWHATTKSTKPGFKWHLELSGNNRYGDWADAIALTDTTFDFEIYDDNELVYFAKDLVEPQHVVEYDLEPCKTYRWTVRPSYKVGSDTKFGMWMRNTTDRRFEKGNLGRVASEAAAYIQDFASIEVQCGKR